MVSVLSIAGGSGIHRPMGKKASPGAEYKSKVMAAGGSMGLLVMHGCQGGQEGAIPITVLERHLHGTRQAREEGGHPGLVGL